MPLIHPPFRIIFLAAAIFSFWCLLFNSGYRTLLQGRIQDDVDRTLDRAIFDILQSLQSNRSNSDALNVLGLREIQQSLACHVQQGSWSGRIYAPTTRCPAAWRSSLTPVLTLCSMLRTKKVLLVGPGSTFHLHTLWLHSLSERFNTSSKCLGPEFCTFHHICLDGAVEASLPATRVKKFPGLRELSVHGSSILRFILSTTLYSSKDSHDPVYTTPIVDPQNGIRTKNEMWIKQARKTDVLVLNQGPAPAPAWTYSFGHNAMAGNWTFVDDLYSNASTRYFIFDKDERQLNISQIYHHRYQRAIRIVNAALHSTLNVYLPRIMETLIAIQNDTVIRTKIIVWHGTWYLNPVCTNHGGPKGFSTEPLLLPPYDVPTVDPWSLYYNAQVYMHDRLLPSLLPHFGIVYLPLSIPLAPANITYKGTKNGGKGLFTEGRKDCIRYPFRESEGRALETAFLGGLVRLLEQMQ
ncbi:hypothetical protein AX15_003454 [Amanita polypyramis BW_CC]|nr:hypothetical protein AX15_003454 [Amanita polypyramis BW_CC]